MLIGWSSWGTRGSRGPETPTRRPTLAQTRSDVGPIAVRAENPSVTRKQLLLSHARNKAKCLTQAYQANCLMSFPAPPQEARLTPRADVRRRLPRSFDRVLERSLVIDGDVGPG